MRVNGMDDIFHEGAPITAMAIPISVKQIASVKRAGKIMRIEAREPMTESMHALKEEPSAAGSVR